MEQIFNTKEDPQLPRPGEVQGASSHGLSVRRRSTARSSSGRQTIMLRAEEGRVTSLFCLLSSFDMMCIFLFL